MDGQSIWVKVNKQNLSEATELKPHSVVTVKYNGKNSNNKLIYPVFYRKRFEHNNLVLYIYFIKETMLRGMNYCL